MELEWQRFFAEHPYVLSMSLPLRLDPQDIMPLARIGKTEPDFIFYPRTEVMGDIVLNVHKIILYHPYLNSYLMKEMI